VRFARFAYGWRAAVDRNRGVGPQYGLLQRRHRERLLARLRQIVQHIGKTAGEPEDDAARPPLVVVWRLEGDILSN
jgi:hypothetical protein